MRQRRIVDMKENHHLDPASISEKYNTVCRQLLRRPGYDPCKDLDLARFYKGASRQVQEYMLRKSQTFR